MERTAIYLMPDWQCFPLWAPGGDPYNVDPRDLGLSGRLCDELMEWARDYDTLLSPLHPSLSGFQRAEERDSFWRRGEILKREIERERPDLDIQLRIT